MNSWLAPFCRLQHIKTLTVLNDECLKPHANKNPFPQTYGKGVTTLLASHLPVHTAGFGTLMIKARALHFGVTLLSHTTANFGSFPGLPRLHRADPSTSLDKSMRICTC